MADYTNHPVIKAYPVCVGCKTPYVLRYGISLSNGAAWYWYRDCKHKTAEAEIMTMEPSE